MNSSRREREIKMKLERDNRQTNQRIGALSEHIEKLMVHLKHEAISKAKTLSECSRCHKEIDLLKKRNQTMEKSNFCRIIYHFVQLYFHEMFLQLSIFCSIKVF